MRLGTVLRKTREQRFDEGILHRGCEVERVQRQNRIERLAHGRDGASMVVAERQRSGTCQAVHEDLTACVAQVDAVCLLERQRNAARVGACVRFTGCLPLQQRVAGQGDRALAQELGKGWKRGHNGTAHDSISLMVWCGRSGKEATSICATRACSRYGWPPRTGVTTHLS